MRDIKGNVVNIQVSGPASAMKAKKLAEPRKIMLGGDLTGSVEFDGSQDVVLEAKVVSGGVQPDYAQNDVTQPNYIKNRPGGYYQTVQGVDITWDGVIGDRPKAQPDEGVYLVKVGDEVLTAEQVIGATVTIVQGAERQNSILSEDDILFGDGFVLIGEGGLSCSKTTVEIAGRSLTLPETGTYFSYMEQDGNKAYISGLMKPETQELVPIPGELTNIKGGYDLPAISNLPVYCGTVPSSAFDAAAQAAKIAVAAAVEKNYGAPITLTNPLAEGATVSGTVNGTAVSGVVAKNFAGDLNAALYTTGASEQVVVVAKAGGSGGALVCILTSDAVVVRDDPPETDMVLVLSQSREAMPKVIPAEYLDVDLNAVESRINTVESVANNAFNKATTAQTTANAAQATANSAQTAATSEIRTNNLCFRSSGRTDNQTTDIPSNLGVRIGNMYKSSTAMQYYPVSLTANRGLEFSADTANPSERQVLLYTEKSNNVISGILELRDNYGHVIKIRPDSIAAYRLTFENGIIIRSSTAGSTKKFKITVDDTGTLSATEVTT